MTDNTRSGADTDDIHCCPICNDPFYGDHTAFENHVNSHFIEEPITSPQDQEFKHPILQRPTNNVEHLLPNCPKEPILLDDIANKKYPAADLNDDFKIICEAKGCNTMVHIRNMAEHMDMHLAEQIQGNHNSTKRTYNPKDNPSAKKFRTKSEDDISTSLSGSNKNESRTGQTTIDSFLSHMPHGPGTSSSKPSSPTQLRLPFLQESTPTTTAGITGLVEKAKMLLEASIMQGVTHHAFLADPSVIFVQSDQTDRGWGCGYRNIQMMLSYVVSQVNSSLTAKDTTVPVTGIPTIPELQRQLEYAWMNGFDVQGANQLSHKVEGTKKWIGTTEAWSIFCSLGIRCNILDFHMPSGPNGTHPAMFAAVYDYFTAPNWSPLSAPATFPVDYVRQRGNENRVIQTAKPPLYMQHQGHSRTIIGIEVLRESQEVNLLVFDPGRWVHKTIPTLSRSAISQSLLPSSGSKVVADDKKLDCQYLLKAFRLQVGAGFAKAQYQLLGISGLYSEMGDRSIDTELSCRSSPSSSSLLTPLQLFTRHPSLSIGWTEEEYENSKSVTSTRVP